MSTAYRMICVLPLLMLLGMSRPRIAQAEQTLHEYQIKAAFLFNFSHYVTWPPEALHENEPFVIGVLGSDPFGKYLDETVNGETVEGHAIAVKRFTSVETMPACHMIYINITDKAELRKIMDKLKGSSVLTISDAIPVERQGGMIRFTTANSKIKLRINLRAAQESGLTISSKLLKLAELVEIKEDSKEK